MKKGAMIFVLAAGVLFAVSGTAESRGLEGAMVPAEVGPAIESVTPEPQAMTTGAPALSDVLLIAGGAVMAGLRWWGRGRVIGV